MPPTQKLCIKCSGTGRKFGGQCYRCSGTGKEPAQAYIKESAESLLFASAEPRAEAIASALEPATSDLAIFKARLDAAIQQVGTNHVSALTAISKLKADVTNTLSIEHKSLWQKLETFAASIQNMEAELSAAISQMESVRPVEITVHTPEGSYTLDASHRHPQFETLLRAASSRQADGYHPNCWISGPAGSGKTTGGRQLAKALDLPFFFNGAVSMEHKLIGFRDASGTYHSTPFRSGYTIPAVYQFDDVDSSENSALLALNAALANGECDFADKLMPRHPDSIILATANTWGLGATADYVGRVKIDAAFLSRFPVKIHWPYDLLFEQIICPNKEWVHRVQAARKAAQAAGLKVIIDPRHSIAGAGLISAGFTPDQAAELTYLANIPLDKRSLVEPNGSTTSRLPN